MHSDQLFDLPALPLEAELTTVLAEDTAVRIERIVSTGQVSDWYDQEEYEFVSLLQGEAALSWADGEVTRLTPGSALTIPPHTLHRVSYTSAQPLCIWLCVFWREPPASPPSE